MECNKYRSVLSIMDPLPARRSHEFVSPSPTSFAPVSRKPLSFSISAILGLEDDGKRDQDFPITGNTSPPELSVHIPSPSPSSPLSSLDSNITSFSSDCDSEPDQLSTHSEKPAKKKRQRTTFSPIEVWELERAYKRRPYLMAEDQEELVQRLGITARSLRYWFQNRRAKSRKEGRELHVTSIRETSQSNRFPAPVSKLHLERMQPWQPQFPVNQARQLESEFQSNQSGPNFLPPSAEVRYRSSFRSNQFISRPPFQLPMYNPDQFKIRPVTEPTILPFSRSSHRYKPY